MDVEEGKDKEGGGGGETKKGRKIRSLLLPSIDFAICGGAQNFGSVEKKASGRWRVAFVATDLVSFILVKYRVGDDIWVSSIHGHKH